MPALELGAPLVVDPVGLGEDEDLGHRVGADLDQHVLDRARHRHQLLLGNRGVDDVQDQVGQPRLLERRAERLDELVGKLADEPDGVGHQVVAAAGAQQSRGRVERVEQAVAHADGRAGQRVQQRRLARVRVSGERDRGQLRALSLGAHHRAAGAHVAELALQRRDPVAREPAVGLDLGLTRSTGADSAVDSSGAEPLQVRPQPSHPREVVFELSELDLELALRGVRV